MSDEPTRRPADPDADTPPILKPPTPEARRASADTSPGSASGSVPGEGLADAPRAAALPGAHQGGFQRALTAPTEITESTHLEQPVSPPVQWAPAPDVLPRSATWALGLAIVALALSLVVGWAFPLGLVAIVLAILALRRPWERRATAVWALALAGLSVLYSAGWLAWAAHQAGLWG